MKKYIIKLFPSKDGIQELLNCKETYHQKETPKFLADGWKGEEPLYYDGGAYYFKCYHQDINNAKLFNSKKAAKNKIDMIYWNTSLFRGMPTFKGASIVEVELSIKEGESEVFDLEERYLKEKASGKDFDKIEVVIKPDMELVVP